MKTGKISYALFVVFCFAISLNTSAQYIHRIKADSVRIYNDSCSSELILENSTKNISGFLYNRGLGRTEFRKSMMKLNDSTYVFGSDTLKLNTGSNYVRNATVQQANANFNISGNGTLGGALSVTGTTLLAPNSGNYARVGIGTPAPAYALDVNGWGRMRKGLILDNVNDYEGLIITGWNYVPLISLRNVGGSSISMLGYNGLTMRTNGGYGFQNNDGSVAFATIAGNVAEFFVPTTINSSLSVSGGTTINGTATLNGGQVIKRTVLTSGATLNDSQYYIAADALAGSFTIYLPHAGGRTGRVFKIKKIDNSANVITISPTIYTRQTIEGQSAYTLQTQWQVITVVCNGTNWEII